MAVPISNVTRRVVFAASGTGPYAFTFEILANTDIAVYEDDTLLTLTTDYTVTINTNGTGSVTLVSAPTGDQIAIVGNRTISRTTDFVTGGDFFANTINSELDQQTIFAQQNAEGLLRSLQAPQTDPTTIDMTLPRASLRANKSLAFDTDGNPVVGEQIGDYRGNWASGTAYNKRDIVKDSSNSNIYYCATAHTSTGTTPISSNTDSAKWTLIVDAEAASDSADAAATSATAAATSATNAASSASSASSSASSASTSAGTATTKASDAATSATAAASSASTASTAATNAGNSATAAATSATNASNSASAASTSASNASSSASAASTSASNASTSATNAASSATAASGSASTASTQATNAATSATNASTSESNASTSATAAASSATAAASSASAAAASYDSFDDRYLGAKSSAPSVDNDGNALLTGALYWNSTSSDLWLWTGSAWTRSALSGTDYVAKTGDTMTGALLVPDGSASAPTLGHSGDTNTGVFFPAADTVAVATGGTERARIDSSGNLGLGVTPSAWGSSYKAFQIADVGVLAHDSVNAGHISLGSNYYRDSTPTWKYISSASATRYTQYVGEHQWFTTASGTAGNPITWTQAMTLDASGNLGIGATSPGSKLDVYGAIRSTLAADTNYYAELTNSNGATQLKAVGTGATMQFFVTGSERARIDSSGNLLVGTTSLPLGNGRLSVSSSSDTVRVYATTTGGSAISVDKAANDNSASQVFIQFTINGQSTGNGRIVGAGSGAVAFASWSDSRLKENIIDLPPQLSNIMALRPVEFDYIESEGGGHQTGFIAQEMQEVYPDVVGERADDGMLSVTGWDKTTARLVKAIQEQQQIIQSLTERITALEGAA